MAKTDHPLSQWSIDITSVFSLYKLSWPSRIFGLGFSGPLTSACMHTQLLGCVQLLVTPWTIAHQAPLSMGFFRQEYWSGLWFPPPGNLPDPGIEPMYPSSLHWQVVSLPLSHLGSLQLSGINFRFTFHFTNKGNGAWKCHRVPQLESGRHQKLMHI